MCEVDPLTLSIRHPTAASNASETSHANNIEALHAR
jgi:hypothetical protein